MKNTAADVPISFTPALRAADPIANYWIGQVNLRLRREVTWMRHQRGPSPDGEPGALPPYVDEVQHTLDLSRFWMAKQAFFAKDPTARYLAEQIEMPPPSAESSTSGPFTWAREELDLDGLSCFTLALGLASAFDSTLGSVVSACLNDPAATEPNMALVQRLWDEPSSVFRMATGEDPLFRYGLLQTPSSPSGKAIAWKEPFYVPPLIAQHLLLDARLPVGIVPLGDAPRVTARTDIVAARLAARSGTPLQIVPVYGPRGAAIGEVVAGVAHALERPVMKSTTPDEGRGIGALAALCWLKAADLFLGEDHVEALLDDHGRLGLDALPPASLPMTLYLGIKERRWMSDLPDTMRTPTLEVSALTYAERAAYWHCALANRAKEVEEAIQEISRRFRYEKRTIDRIAAELRKLSTPLSAERVTDACRAEVELDIGELAQPVAPRFKGERLVLPRPQEVQFDELARAVEALTGVHYTWDTADAWNEAGITALFAGPSGTGKTMAAEILARQLGLPMYRVDLSQVVNKYIGETEKNLKRLFDAADASDVLLFFDEADAVFGRRTAVKDAHDRYANLEVSYLLERMERFKGVAILASNRKKDLDEAFTRRLHFVIDFPVPDVPQREAIWRQVIPSGVDASRVDFAFLARQFQLTGGHIRSIVFQACLQRAAQAPGEQPVLCMEDVIVAVKRELDKLGRPLTLHQFGRYADLVESISTGP